MAILTSEVYVLVFKNMEHSRVNDSYLYTKAEAKAEIESSKYGSNWKAITLEDYIDATKSESHSEGYSIGYDNGYSNANEDNN